MQTHNILPCMLYPDSPICFRLFFIFLTKYKHDLNTKYIMDNRPAVACTQVITISTLSYQAIRSAGVAEYQSMSGTHFPWQKPSESGPQILSTM